jgi:DNA replication protein DnaC
MKQTDPEKLPRRKQFEYVLHWENYPLGLVLYGGSGLGKTRTMWALLRQECELCKSAEFVRGADFQKEVTSRTKPNGSDNFDEWFEELATVDVLFLDDIDKMRFTQRAEQEFFNLIDVRTSAESPTIISLNSTAAELCDEMSPKFGPPLIRRLGDYFETVNFNPDIDEPVEQTPPAPTAAAVKMLPMSNEISSKALDGKGLKFTA